MTVADFGCLLVDNWRSKAYVQKLCEAGLVPAAAVYVDLQPRGRRPNEGSASESTAALIDQIFRDRKYFLYDPKLRTNAVAVVDWDPPRKYRTFDPDRPVVDTLHDFGVPHEVVGAASINADQVVAAVKRAPAHYFLFGGGGILRPEMFATGKEFIHCHPGWLPAWRGSHCLEWSVLAAGECSATAFFMTETIDQGAIIMRRRFGLPGAEHNNIAPFFSSHIRSELIVAAVSRFAADGGFPREDPGDEPDQTFFKMHPALTNLVLDRIKDV